MKGGREAEREIGREGRRIRDLLKPNPVRGDLSIWVAILTYALSTASAVLVCRWLIPDFPWIFFAGFGFLYVPIISYASAKLEGLVGQTVQIPYVREAVYVLSGYRGVAIWFAPMPIVDCGTRTRDFRVMELTGTRVSGLIKTELVCIPIVLVGSLLFSEFIWRLGPIPSEAYPYTQEVWRLWALTSCLTYTATTEGSSMFLEAIKLKVILLGLGLGVGSFWVLSLLKLPTLLVFGVVRGLGQTTPGHVVPEIIGALIGRFYLERKFGRKRWRKLVPVILAGFTCGLGLMAMAGVGIALIWKSISTLLY
jgi:hypothetical protein